MFDWIIRNGRVIDGTGNPPFRADVALQDGKIAFVGLLPADAPAAHTLDATGHCVTPGFIDVHSHADVTVFDNPQSHNKAGQGITTDISGNCGTSNAPRDGWTIAHEEKRAGKPGGLGFLSSYGQTMAHIESLALASTWPSLWATAPSAAWSAKAKTKTGL